uniref:Arogenate dehydrogenase n=1 Tax=Hordeum vulgare subsp. vulgare TaxID=112509 RepID=A0A8I7BJR0_HORVV
MQGLNKSPGELFEMQKVTESELRKEHQVLMVNKTTSFKRNGKGKKGNSKKSGKPVANPTKKPKAGPKPETECYYCKGMGHWKRNCPKYLADKKISLCHPDVVLLATSILSAEAVLRSLPLHRLRRSTLFVDVLSVKEFPKNLLLTSLPEGFDILCTHPMFGPESARDGWDGLPFVFDRVRVGDSPARRARANAFLNIFEREGCRMVEMCCAEHDAHAAETQFLTHTVGRMLATLELSSTPINTKGYETLLRLVDNTCSDSFDLYNGLFMYNKNSTDLLNRLESAMDSVKKRLFDGLHEVLRKQLFEGKASPPLTTTTSNHTDVRRRQLLLEGKPPSPSVPTPNNVTVPK